MVKRPTVFVCIAVVCVVVGAGCVADRESMQKVREAEKGHEELALQPTPQEWRAGAVWRFVTTSSPGKPAREILTFRVTEKPGVSCLAGGGWKDVWYKFAVIEGHLPSGPPLYQVEGRALRINLSGDMCDAYDIIEGVLNGGDFTGRRTTFGLMFKGEVVGTVQGSCVQR